MIDSVQEREAGTRPATVRDALDAALRGAPLNGVRRARAAGRAEAALTTRQLEIMVTALEDAAVYRESGADALGCWDCENIPGGRCADHAKDTDRARAYTELAAQLAASGSAGAAGRQHPTGIPGISGFRRRTSVAS
jgi:hypothetical protein